MPLLGADQVYVVTYGHDYHTALCPLVADKWVHTPRGLVVTGWLRRGADIVPGMRRSSDPVGGFFRPGDTMHLPPTQTLALDAVIPLKVVEVAHGILFLAAGHEYRERLRESAVEPATPLLAGGQRDGMLVRIAAARHVPLLVVQLDPRATFRNGPYQVGLRRPLQRSATKPYAVESVERTP